MTRKLLLAAVLLIGLAPATLQAQHYVTVCVVQDGWLRNVRAEYNPATGDTLVDGRVPFHRAYPTGAQYAAGAPWYIANEAITLDGDEFVKIGIPRVIAISDLKRHAEYRGLPLFVDPTESGTIYVPVRPGCEFQRYRSAEGQAAAAERDRLNRAYFAFSPAFRSALVRARAQPERILVQETFDRDHPIEDAHEGRYVVVRGRRLHLMQRAQGQAGTYGWAVPHEDVIVRYVFRYESGATNNGAGILLRNGITVTMNSSRESGNSYQLGNTGSPPLVTWARTELIRGRQDNVVEVAAIGTTLTIFVNGQHLRTVTDLPRRSGSRIALRVGTREMTYSFDDVTAIAVR